MKNSRLTIVVTTHYPPFGFPTYQCAFLTYRQNIQAGHSVPEGILNQRTTYQEVLEISELYSSWVQVHQLRCVQDGSAALRLETARQRNRAPLPLRSPDRSKEFWGISLPFRLFSCHWCPIQSVYTFLKYPNYFSIRC